MCFGFTKPWLSQYYSTVFLAGGERLIPGVTLIGNIIALHRAQTMALDTILQIAPADIAGKCIAAKVANRFRKTDYIKGPSKEHSELTACMV